MNKIRNKWFMKIMKYLSLPFSIFISFVSFYQTIRIIFYTNDNNKLLMIDLTIIVFLLLYLLLNIFFYRRTVIFDYIKVFANNLKVFISLFLLLTSLFICFTYYINYKFGRSRLENYNIMDKYIIVLPKDETIKTYKIHSDCDKFPDIRVDKEFYDKVKNGMELSFIINDGILGFSVLKEVKGKEDGLLRYEFCP